MSSSGQTNNDLEATFRLGLLLRGAVLFGAGVLAGVAVVKVLGWLGWMT